VTFTAIGSARLDTLVVKWRERERERERAVDFINRGTRDATSWPKLKLPMRRLIAVNIASRSLARTSREPRGFVSRRNLQFHPQIGSRFYWSGIRARSSLASTRNRFIYRSSFPLPVCRLPLPIDPTIELSSVVRWIPRTQFCRDRFRRILHRARSALRERVPASRIESEREIRASFCLSN